MIVGISHIVRGSAALDADRRVFEALGWSVSFTERGLPTPDDKRPFMATRSNSQDLVYLRPSLGPALELIHYADVIPLTDPPVQLVLPLPADLSAVRDAETGDLVSLAGMGVGPMFSLTRAGLTGSLWFTPQHTQAATLIHFVRDLAQATEFWTKGFGFAPASPARTSPDWITLTTRSPLPQWRIAVTLVRRDDCCREWLLDGPGVRCLSFVSTARDVDGRALLGAGAEPGTAVMPYTINGQRLDVQMFKGPDGLMVELVSLPGDRSKGRC